MTTFSKKWMNASRGTCAVLALIGMSFPVSAMASSQIQVIELSDAQAQPYFKNNPAGDTDSSDVVLLPQNNAVAQKPASDQKTTSNPKPTTTNQKPTDGERSGSALEPDNGNPLDKIGQGLVLLDKIINLGKEAWQVVQSGHAVANIDTQSGSALPYGVKGPMDLTGWRVRTKNYKIIDPNDGRTVEFVFRLSMLYGGSYQGQGHYLANITVQPADYKAQWDTTFDVRARIPSDGIVNMSTQDDPMAAAEVFLDWSKSRFEYTGGSVMLYVQGDGTMQNMSADDSENINPVGN